MANANTNVLETVTRGFIGKTLTHAMLEALVINAVPAWKDKLPSLNIPDHAPSAKQAKQYADHLFDRTTAGYAVRASDKITRKPATSGRTRGPVDHAKALKDAQALLASVPTPKAPTAPTNGTPAKDAVKVIVAGETAKPAANQPSATK